MNLTAKISSGTWAGQFQDSIGRAQELEELELSDSDESDAAAQHIVILARCFAGCCWCEKYCVRSSCSQASGCLRNYGLGFRVEVCGQGFK